MCHDEDAMVYGNVAVVTCEEALDDNTLVATNIFRPGRGCLASRPPPGGAAADASRPWRQRREPPQLSASGK